MAQLIRNFVLFSHLFNELQVFFVCVNMGMKGVPQTLEMSGNFAVLESDHPAYLIGLCCMRCYFLDIHKQEMLC